MLEIVRGNTELKALDELLQSVPGVGFVVSSTLLSSLPELGSASRGAISSLVGVAPLNHDSDHARSDPCPSAFPPEATMPEGAFYGQEAPKPVRCCCKGKTGAFWDQESQGIIVRTFRTFSSGSGADRSTFLQLGSDSLEFTGVA